MADSNTSPVVSQLFQLANNLSVPFAQKLAGQQVSSADADKAMLAERLRMAALNGSGPNNPVEAARAPQGVLDFITGQSGPGDTKGNGSNRTIWLVVAGLGAVLVYLALRK